MRLEAFTVRNFRSIRRAARIPVRAGMTVLIGPNNEGKTNLLRALGLAQATLQLMAGAHWQGRRIWAPSSDPSRVELRPVLMPYRPSAFGRYEWGQDFPLALQDGRPHDGTVVRLTYSLTAQECADFQTEVGHTTSSTLPVEFTFGPRQILFGVPKQRWAPQLSKKAGPIAAFITARLRYEYIPAVRTHEHATRVIDEVLAARLGELEHDDEYSEALETVKRLQKPVLESLSRELTESLRDFLPGINEVRVELTQAQRFERMRTPSDVIVDDGAATSLSNKGDGIISLAAIGLMQSAVSGTRARQLLLAIEEPEAHLHPQAMHRLREVLRDLSGTQQVILTTHSPLFVERGSAAANVLVRRSSAEPAKNLAAIREALGVRVQDNLFHADVVLLVEGTTDRDAVTALLAVASPPLCAAVEDGRLAVQVLGGCGKLPAAVYAIEHCVVTWHCLLDFDKVARDCFAALVRQRIARQSQGTFTTLGRLREAEIEDWYRVDAYRAQVVSSYGPVLDSLEFQQTRGKWTTRLAAAFTAAGLDWGAEEDAVKRLVADAVAGSPADALCRKADAPFSALQRALESALSKAVPGDDAGDRVGCSAT